MVCVKAVLEPDALLAMSVMVYVPAWLYVTVGFCALERMGWPPPGPGPPGLRVYDHDVGVPLERSVICTIFVAPEQTGLGLIEKLAPGICDKPVKERLTKKSPIPLFSKFLNRMW